MASESTGPSTGRAEPSTEADTESCVAAAIALLEQGKSDQAIAVLRQSLTRHPASPLLWLELGNAYMEQGCLPEAIEAYAQSTSLDASISEAWANLAMALREQGRFDEAITAYQRCIALDPSDGEALIDLGLLFQERDRFDQALAAFQQARSLRPSPGLLSRMADLLLRQGDLEAAIAHYRQALALPLPAAEQADGERHEIFARLGVALHRQGHLEEAIDAYGQALVLRPQLEEVQSHRAAAMEQLRLRLLTQAQRHSGAGNNEAAITLLKEGLERCPDHPDLLTDLAKLLLREGDLHEAFPILQRAAELRPDDPELWCLIGMIQQDQGQGDQGQEALLRALHLRLKDPHTLLQLALRLHQLGLGSASLEAFEQRARLAPDDGEISMDLAAAHLRLGRFQEGWTIYESRWQLRQKPSGISLPLWQPGRPCDGLLILSEQGLGDQILAASMLEETAGWARAVAVMAEPRLRSLFERSFPRIQFLDMGQPFDEGRFQAHIMMGSLGAHLRQRQEDFPPLRKSYLRADPERTGALRLRHGTGDGLVCGISWRSTNPQIGAKKSLTLHRLATSLALPGIRLLSLQYGDAGQEIDELRQSSGIDVVQDPEVDTTADIDGLAALISVCDLVVSISNTNANLAGALGKPTWVLLDGFPDWRWGMEDGASLWYPSARLFRQPRAGAWEEPLQALRAELAALLMRGVQADPAPAASRRWRF